MSAAAAPRLWGCDRAALDQLDGLDDLERLERNLHEGLGLPGGERHDAHVHLGSDADGHHLDAPALIADLDAAGITSAVCFPANEPGPEGTFERANRRVVEAAAEFPERIVPFCRVDPAIEAGPTMERAARQGARGLKLHPVAQGFRPEGREAVAAVRLATELGWPVLIHAGFGARRLARPLRKLRFAVPECRLILAHGGRGDARALAGFFTGDAQVAFDTSLATVVDLAGLAPEQLMLGSDRPYGEHGSALHLVACAARVAGWTDGQLRGVLGANLQAWLR